MRRTLPVLFFLGCLLALATFSQAQGGQPKEMVESIYARFTDPAGPGMSDFAMLRPIAAPGLAELLDKETACQEKGEEICKYDFSILVNGQDYELTELEISQGPTTAKNQEVTAQFLNFGQPSEIIFSFALYGDAWLLEDIRKTGEYPVSLAELLQ